MISACTSACTGSPESAHPEAPVGDFAAAMMMVERLPLTDAEKAEAVRRLLVVSGAGSKAAGV